MKTSQSQSLETSLESDSPVKQETPLVKKVVINLLKFGVTAGILYFLYQKGMLDLARVRQVLTNPVVVGVTLIVLVFTNLVAVVRWQLLLRGQSLPIPYFEAFKLSMIGVFFNTAIPGAVSGDLIKGYYIVSRQPSKRGRIRAFTTLLLDRLLGLSALICVSFFAMLFNIDEILKIKALQPLCVAITLTWLGVVLFYIFVLGQWSFSSKIQGILHKLPLGDLFARFFESVKTYENQKHLMIKGLVLSMAIHLSLVGAISLLARSFASGFEMVNLSQFFFLVPMGLLVTAIPIAPAGLGTGHAAFAGLFHLAGSSSGADLFTAYVSFQIFFSLVGGLFYVKYRVNS